MSQAASAGSLVLSNRLQKTQADVEKEQAETAARGEELRMLQREADRKDRLASALATQNALAGARGVAAFEGSPLAILEDSIRREETATERDRFSTQMETLALRSGARVRHRLARASRTVGLLQGTSELAQQAFRAGGGIGG